MLNGRSLDKNVPIPLYYQLKNMIGEEIDKGNYPVDGLIPTEVELSEMFQISRTTVRQAITELVQEGRLYRIKSKGTFVARPKLTQEFMNRLQSFNDEIISNNQTPSTEVLDLSVVTMPDAFAKQRGEHRDAKAICLYRKRCADGEAVVHVRTYLPYRECGFVLDCDFAQNSLYRILSRSEDTQILRVSRTCEAVAADAEDARILGVTRGDPIHFFTTFGYNAKGEALEYSLARYRGDRSRFHVEISV